MQEQLIIPGGQRVRRASVSPAALEEIARHARSAGCFLMMLDPSGQCLFSDPQAPAFFQRYANCAITAGALAAHLTNMSAESAATEFALPGLAIAVAPQVERRSVQGYLLLCAREKDFALTEDVLRTCGQASLDAQYLEDQALKLPGHSTAEARSMLHLLSCMLRQQLRCGFLENEINSLSTQLANAYEELSLIDQINGGMRVNRRISDFFRQACMDVKQVLGVRAMGVTLFAEKCREEPALYGELELPLFQLHHLSDRLLLSLQQRGGCLLINELAAEDEFAWLSEHARRLIAVPLQRGEHLLGCLFGLDKPAEFDSVDSKLLNSIASESAVFIENSMLYGDVHDLMMGLLHSLTSAIDAKDNYTCGHSERVALLARHLATRAGLDDQTIEKMYMAGLLHDVGKIGVAEQVLRKTGRLNAEEFEQMKKHPLIGARILGDVKQLEEVIPGVLHHHERYDGRGYPNRLAGKQIPLMGRIICLADSLDAMTSNRTYRKALPLEVALTEIRRCSGTQFDPELAEIFLQISPGQFRMLLQEYQQQSRRYDTLRAAS